MVILEYFQNHMHQAIYEQLLNHVEFYIIVHDDDEQHNYVYNHQHDNDLMLYFQTKIIKIIIRRNGVLFLHFHDDLKMFY